MSSEIRAQFEIARPGFRLSLDLNLPGQGITALFGHSGSGKTTCLRAMAGLERAAQGYFALGETVWQDATHGVFVPPHQRAIGVVFQEANLFPHLTVLRNMQFGQDRIPSAQRPSATAKQCALDGVVELLGIGHLQQRLPHELSGGERQRVAIARALLAAPKILLMDEPLAALDLQRKHEILPYLERLHAELSLPVIYVSHAPDEVARLADHLVLLDQGQVVASGPLNAVLTRMDLPAAFADDAGVVVQIKVQAHEDDGLTRLAFKGGELYVSRRDEALETPLRCRIHARDVSLALNCPADSSILNRVEVVVDSLAEADTPGHMLVRLFCREAPETCLLARITRRSCNSLALHPGLCLWAQIKAVALLA